MRVILLLALLAGCTNVPTTPDGPQCSPIFKYVTSLEGDEYISVAESYCLCRQYRISLDYIGVVPNTESWREPIKACEKLVGWSPVEYGKKVAFFEEVRRILYQRVNNGR